MNEDLFDYSTKYATYKGDATDVPIENGITTLAKGQEVKAIGSFEGLSGGIGGEFG